MLDLGKIILGHCIQKPQYYLVVLMGRNVLGEEILECNQKLAMF